MLHQSLLFNKMPTSVNSRGTHRGFVEDNAEAQCAPKFCRNYAAPAPADSRHEV
jgi:hypothetical protein